MLNKHYASRVGHVDLSFPQIEQECRSAIQLFAEF